MTCGERNRQIIALYQGGMSKRDIQERMGISSYSLSKILDAWAKHGDKIFESKKTVYTHVKGQAETIKRLRAEGKSWTEIVGETGVSRSSMYRLLLDEKDMSDDIAWMETERFEESEFYKREAIKVGDAVRFWSRGREVVAVVSGKHTHTIQCTETLRNGIKITYSPQYRDVERVGGNDEEVYTRGN